MSGSDAADFFRKMHFRFDVMQQINVNGDNAHPLYKYMKRVVGGDDVKGNFEKFLIDKQGKPIKRYSSSATISVTGLS